MYTTQFYNARGKYSSSLYHLRKDYVAYSHCLVAYLTLQCGKNILDKKLMLTFHFTDIFEADLWNICEWIVPHFFLRFCSFCKHCNCTLI